MTPWSEVAGSDKFKALPPAEQEAARSQYFNEVVAPKVKPEELASVRAQFDSDTAASKPDRSAIEQVVRQFGLTARYAVEGVTALPNLVGNALGLKSSEAVSNLLTKMGLPLPENATERVVGDVATGMAGAATMSGAGAKVAETATRPVVQHVARMFADSPGLQVASGATGGAAGGIAREAGAGPMGQLAASVVGGVAPAAIPALGAAAARGAVRGGPGSIPAAQERIQQFRDAGTTPSASQAFQTHGAQATEAFLARNPGSHGAMRDFAMKQAAEVGKQVDEAAGVLAGKTSPMIAGRAVEQGIIGEGGFLDHFKAVSKTLYDKLDTYLPADKPVAVTNTQRTLAELTTPAKGAEETTRLLVNAKVLQVQEALKSDVGGKPGKTVSILGPDGKPVSSFSVGGTAGSDALPYGALKDLRSRVGEMISDSGMTSDIPRRQLKRLYAGISRDMEAAVKATGDKQAEVTFDRANAYTKAGHDRIDNILQPIIDRDAPEKIFQAALSGSKEGDTTIRSVMQSLPPANQKVLAATVLRKLGKATGANQTAEGDLFSVSTYLTNWATISPEAKRSLFSRFGPQFTKSLDQIAKTASDIREGGRVYANPSGTAPAFTLQHTIGGTVILMLTGHFAIASAVVAESAGSAGVAKLMTNPDFVNWLAKSTTIPTSAAPAAINQLVQTANKKNDPEMMKFALDLDKQLVGAK